MLNLPRVGHINIPNLIGDVERGHIQIPQFQREFVWTIQKSAELLDSVLKGYPLGTFIFWKTRERFPNLKELGGFELPTPPENDNVSYILDGQQRITSLFAVWKGLEIPRGVSKVDYFSNLYVDLNANCNEQIILIDPEDRSDSTYITLNNLLHGDFDFLANFPKEYEGKLKLYRQQIMNYEIPTIEISDRDIDSAIEVFARINVTGVKLTLFDVIVAKTFDQELNFDLKEKFENLTNNLEAAGFDSINNIVPLQLIALLIGKECTGSAILELNKNEFIESWDLAEQAIERAVDYFRVNLGIPVNKLLPYQSLMVPFSYFFAKQDSEPTIEQQKFLNDFFWRVSLTTRYSASVNAKLAQDKLRIEQILDGKLPTYDWGLDISSNWLIQNGEFNVNRSFIKAILCLYTSFVPKAFDNNAIVNIQENWLRRRNSKNYHHFFPLSYLKKNGIEESFSNNIINITIVSDYLNRNTIGAKPPSEYIPIFQKQNKDIEETLKTHLITNLSEFGILDADYEKFITERAKVISNELSKRIVPAKSETKFQVLTTSDFEFDTLEFKL